jgi:aminobenzoyl-glutamate transport protein
MGRTGGGILRFIEGVGNRLPDPAALFFAGTIVVILMSHLAVLAGWTVEGMVIDRETGELVERAIAARSLLEADGFAWVFLNLEKNFLGFPPLGVVLVGMLGVGVAERSGFLPAALKAVAAAVPGRFLTPTMIFLGISSSAASDAGYIVLPPLAAALYHSVGRSPAAGIAAVFAGVSAGFNANLLLTSLDPMLARMSTEGARILDPSLIVKPTCNHFFLAASTVVLTLAGWWTSDRFIERPLSQRSGDRSESNKSERGDAGRFGSPLDGREVQGLWAACGSIVVTGAFFLALILIPGAPLHGEVGGVEGAPSTFQRWVAGIVPIITIGFFVPGVVYGVRVGTIQSNRDVARLFSDSMAGMAPIIVLAFFAGQFIACFGHSNLGLMLALGGGGWLAGTGWPPFLMIVAFILVTMIFNLLVGSMSAKYALFAPVFVPMFLAIGIAPELVQLAYRIGDSTTNIITPLNPYLVIVLGFLRVHVPSAGIGTLISLMLPYTVVFTIIWVVMLGLWLAAGIPLGY